MQEEKIYINLEEITDGIEVEDFDQNVEKEESVEFITVEKPQELVIEMEEAFAPLGESNETLDHAALNNREAADQHPTKAIIGLDNKLAELSALRNVSSHSGGLAEFRKWKDKNPSGINRVGYFVSIANADGDIVVCNKENSEVYGVTVARSGFCGYQNDEYDFLDSSTSDKANNWQYAQVCLVGDVKVRVNPSDKIMVGDYVLPNEIGCASKSENDIGFRVLSVGSDTLLDKDEKETLAHYVTIALVPQNDNISRVVEKLNGTQINLENVQIEIGNIKDSVTGALNSNINLSNKVDGLEDIFGKLDQNFDSMKSEFDSVEETVNNAESNAALAIEKANLAYNKAAAEAKKAADDANSALASVNGLKADLSVLVSWPEVQVEGEDSGIAGFVAQSNKDRTQLSSLVATVNKQGSDISTIQQINDKNGATIQHLVAHADKYSVGPYSLSYGLSYEEAKGILQPGHIYVSTSSHTEISDIYICQPTEDVLLGTECFFKVNDDIIYGFVSPEALSKSDLLQYSSTMNEIIIGENTIQPSVVTDTTGMIELSCQSEYYYSFEPFDEEGYYGMSYKWGKNPDYDIYEWQFNSYISTSANTVPNAIYKGEGVDTSLIEGDLWYCWQGIEEDNKYLYNPETLYRWDGTRWISVATIDGNIQARSLGLVKQTAKELSSTYTNLRGDMSVIKQDVNNISTTVTNVEGGLSTINQKVDNIYMGTFTPEESSTLGIALNQLQAVTEGRYHTKINSFEGFTTVVGNRRYSQAPSWDEELETFIFDEAYIDDNGKYYFNSEDWDTYCKDVVGGYEVYTIGNTATSSLNSSVSEVKSSIESLAELTTDNSTNITTIQQKVDTNSAQISSIASGEYIVRTNIKTPLTDEEINSLMSSIASRTYAQPPEWRADEKCFEFTDNNSQPGLYFMLNDTQHYYKLIEQDGRPIGYEEYAMVSYGLASIMQKVTENSSAIGMVADSNGIKAEVIVEAINGNSSALISADNVSIHGTTKFSDMFNPDTTTISGDYIRSGVIQSNNYNGKHTQKIGGYTVIDKYEKLAGTPDVGSAFGYKFQENLAYYEYTCVLSKKLTMGYPYWFTTNTYQYRFRPSVDINANTTITFDEYHNRIVFDGGSDTVQEQTSENINSIGLIRVNFQHTNYNAFLDFKQVDSKYYKQNGGGYSVFLSGQTSYINPNGIECDMPNGYGYLGILSEAEYETASDNNLPGVRYCTHNLTNYLVYIDAIKVEDSNGNYYVYGYDLSDLPIENDIEINFATKQSDKEIKVGMTIGTPSLSGYLFELNKNSEDNMYYYILGEDDTIPENTECIIKANDVYCKFTTSVAILKDSVLKYNYYNNILYIGYYKDGLVYTNKQVFYPELMDRLYYAEINPYESYNLITYTDNPKIYICPSSSYGLDGIYDVFANETKLQQIKISDRLQTYENSNYSLLVSASDFTLYPTGEMFGMRLDLMNGTIASNNFFVDNYGNTTMAGKMMATSGYIGNADGGFTIGQRTDVITHVCYNGSIDRGNYWVEINGGIYTFSIPSYTSVYLALEFNLNILQVIVMRDRVQGGTRTNAFNLTHVSTIPTEYTELKINNGYYFLSHKQSSVYGDWSGDPGIYLGPDGIGAGNGAFSVDYHGNMGAKSLYLSEVNRKNVDNSIDYGDLSCGTVQYLKKSGKKADGYYLEITSRTGPVYIPDLVTTKGDLEHWFEIHS